VILCDKSIKRMVDCGELVISPYNEEYVGPGSYDVCLSGEFGYYVADYYTLDCDYDKYLEKVNLRDGDNVLVLPGWWKYDEDCFSEYNVEYVFIGGVLGLTKEWIELPNNVCAQYQGRSSLGRLFLTSHQTAGWIDAGFKGRIVLEIVAHDKPVILTVGKRIGQLIFFMMDDYCSEGYCDMWRSKYKFQSDVVGFKKDKF